MRWRFLALLALIPAFSPPPARAQESGLPSMFWVYQERVKPAMVPRYEAATRELIGLLGSVGEVSEPIRFTTVSSMEKGYYFVIPIDAFAGIDRAFDEWQRVVETIGRERWQDVEVRIRPAIESTGSTVILLRPDLSYLPETVTLDAEQPYRRHYWWYITPGMEQDFEGVAKEFVQLYEEQGIESGWRVYQALMGEEMPMYLVVDRADSPYGYEVRDKQVMDRLGPKARELGMKAMKAARRMEVTDGWVRPDLSFPPPEAAPGE